MPGVNGTPQGIVHVACLISRLVNDLLHILHAGVAVLTVPEEVEDTHVVILCHNAYLRGVKQRTVKIVRACVAAEQIDFVVGNGVGNGIFTRAVGNGGVFAVIGVSDLKRACVVVIRTRCCFLECGIRPLGLGQRCSLLLALLLLLCIFLVCSKIKCLRLFLAVKECKITKLDCVTGLDALVHVQRVKAQLGKYGVLHVCPAFAVYDQLVPFTIGSPIPFQMGSSVLREGDAVISCNVYLTHYLGGGTVFDHKISRVCHLDIGRGKLHGRVVFGRGKGGVFTLLDLVGHFCHTL